MGRALSGFDRRSVARKVREGRAERAGRTNGAAARARSRALLATALVALATLREGGVARAQTVELLQNGDFEQGAAGWGNATVAGGRAVRLREIASRCGDAR